YIYKLTNTHYNMNFKQIPKNQHNFSIKTRAQNLTRLELETFDILVIGGGIIGAAITNDAISRGYKVALIEQNDFASGASSKSSKLIHGGLRYLANFQFKLMAEACQQRQMLLEQESHLVRPLPFMLPIYQGSQKPLWQIRLAMWIYDRLGQHKTAKARWPQHQIWSAAQTVVEEPLLKSQGLIKTARYYDCATDDARFTLNLILKAHRDGAVITNYTQFTDCLEAKNQVVGAQVYDKQQGRQVEVKAKVVISAVGPWTDKLIKQTNRYNPPWLAPTKGVHVVVPHHRLPCHAALTFDTSKDRRYMFLIPWGTHTIIGTTDTEYADDPSNVAATAADVAYILDATKKAFPTANIDESDLTSTYAGVRPLIHNHTPAQKSYYRSREHKIIEIKPGFFAIAGGKFTTHRIMAQEAVDKIRSRLSPTKSQTKLTTNNTLHHYTNASIDQCFNRLTQIDLSPNSIQHLTSRYGADASSILNILAETPILAQPIISDQPVIKAEIIHAIRNEMALHLTDFLDQRTHLIARATNQALDVAQQVADLMAIELSWTGQEKARQVANYHRHVHLNRQWQNL
ncbi:MAG: glycerol-3-phosphate dehydrogenase/oxidase, partial [Chloroflexota bacterium]